MLNSKRGDNVMRRRVLMVIVAIALLCCVFGALVACESYKADPISPVADKDALVESNGGLAVKQGNYVYFINGYSGYLTDNGEDNWFGNVIKGAIYRGTLKEDGSLGDYVVVVPKSVMADSQDVGFSVFGEYIYYVSPSPDEDRNSGKVNTSTLQFLRTKIDGTGTQLILSVDNTSVRYKYTATKLFVYDDTNSENKILYAKDLTASSFSASDMGDVVAEKVTSVWFPKNENYDPKKTEAAIGDYVFYTVDTEDEYDSDNVLCVASPDLRVNKKVIKENSYTDKTYNISVIASALTDDGKIALYYTKTSYAALSTTAQAEGTFAYLFDSTFTFNEGAEKMISNDSLSGVYAVGFEGLLQYGESNKTVFYKTNGEKISYGDLKMNTFITMDDTYFYYLNSDTKLLRFAKSDDQNACYAYSANDKQKFMTSFTGVDRIGDYLYGIVDDEYDYVYRLDLTTIDPTDPSATKFERIGVATEEDEAKMKAAESSDSDSEK